MKFIATPLAGAYVIEREPLGDDRGYFARIWCRDEFTRHGLNADLAQCSVSQNHLRGTLRGMHFQAAPHREAKLVRCPRGAIFDVIVDIRTGSPTYAKWFGAELSAANGRMMYAPEDFAHGFLTLADDTEVAYQISTAYVPAAARGFRWDDPAVGIAWPEAPAVISERDRQLPCLNA